MATKDPVTALDPRYGNEDATPTSWADARRHLDAAEIYWLTTVRADGRPHVTPLIGVLLDDALHFCTGPEERKAKNLASRPHCILTTGRNDLDEGYDIVVEGDARTVDDKATLDRIATGYETKYGPHFTAPDGTFHGLSDSIRGGDALVYEVAPSTAFGFGKGQPFSQTRWRF
ncbi:pyridoxamine 5'-phosphate oxidase family protein [Actinopolymorpha pittospori]|uniref:General stress protein 26 n=1 Tax=Actinopolymorpha pittospori TaxID=648752 RepID=A0A927RI66_9ACTN|nr:pyridoxamine 5'-phosphate oxidase family protein [Actinopolymorpha pittospori]MBE1605866.1 general stress protein 26 [Actinopolymorpha pittospori]